MDSSDATVTHNVRFHTNLAILFMQIDSFIKTHLRKSFEYSLEYLIWLQIRNQTSKPTRYAMH